MSVVNGGGGDGGGGGESTASFRAAVAEVEAQVDVVVDAGGRRVVDVAAQVEILLGIAVDGGRRRRSK